MDIISSIVSAFFKAFVLMGGLLMAGVDAIAADIRAPLVHQGLPPEAAVVIVAFIPILTLIAAWRLFRGKVRLVIAAVLVAAILRILIPAVIAMVR